MTFAQHRMDACDMLDWAPRCEWHVVATNHHRFLNCYPHILRDSRIFRRSIFQGSTRQLVNDFIRPIYPAMLLAKAPQRFAQGPGLAAAGLQGEGVLREIGRRVDHVVERGEAAVVAGRVGVEQAEVLQVGVGVA